MESERAKYADRPLVQTLFYDIWFDAYFQMQKGRYIDNMRRPEEKLIHGELMDSGQDLDSDWAWKTLENDVRSAGEL